MSEDTARLARFVGMAGFALLGLGCVLVLRPFLSALAWAAILTFSTWPLFAALHRRLHLPAGIAAALMVSMWFLLVGLPVVLATPATREEIEALRSGFEAFLMRGLPGLGNWASDLPLVGAWIRQRIGEGEFDLLGLEALLRPHAAIITQQAIAILLAVLSGIAELLLAIFFAFFFYRDGETLATRAEVLLGRLGGDLAKRLLVIGAAVTRGVVWGLIGTAIAQGALSALGLWLAGVPEPLLLGVITAIISVLPIGAPLVWIPASLWLLSEGETARGIFLALYGVLVISTADNIIRSWAIARGAKLPLLVTLLGVLGGVLAFGFLGLFLGPVVLALGYALLGEFAKSPAHAIAQPPFPHQDSDP